MRYLILIFVMFAANCFGQEVEHNYEMGPQITTCDSLDLTGLAVNDQIEKVEKAKFRAVQNFKLNRREGFQAAWFYSCDNERGFLVAQIDGQKKLYKNVNKTQWDALIASGDFENFITEKIAPD